MKPRGQIGMTLAECTAAIALLGLATFVAGAFFAGQQKLAVRLAAQEEATRALEFALESVRAGAIPLGGSDQDVALPTIAQDAHGLVVRLHIHRGDKQGLWIVVADAVFVVQGQRQERQVTTMVWRPS